MGAEGEGRRTTPDTRRIIGSELRPLKEVRMRIKNRSAEDIPTHHVQKVYAERQALLHKLFGPGGGVSIVSVRGT